MIALMKHLEIICMRGVLTELTEFIQQLGVLHIEETPLNIDEVPDFLHRVHLTREQRADLEALEALQATLRELAPLLAANAGEKEIAEAARSYADQDPAKWRRAVRGWSRDLRSLSRRKGNIFDNVELLNSFRRTLRTVAPLVQGQPVVLGKNGRAFVLKGDVERVLNQLEERRHEELGPGTDLFSKRLARNAAVAVLTYPEELDRAVQNLLREHHIAPVDLPDKTLNDRPLNEVLEQVEKDLAEQESSLQAIRDELDVLSQTIAPRLSALERLIADRLGRLHVMTRFAHSELVGVIHGWIPAEDTADFVRALEERFPEAVSINELSVEHIDKHRIPTLLRNHPLFQPFEVLLSLFDPPRYGSFDPSVLVGVFFVLFYGFILGDVFYGAIVLGLALWMRTRWRSHPVVRAAGSVGVYMGISSIVFGVLFGEYCGDLGARWLGLQPVWFHRGHDTTALLLIAIAAGAVHITISLVLGIREALRHGGRKHALEQAAMLVGLMGLGAGALAYADVAPFSTTPGMVATVLLLAACALMLVKASGFMAPIQFMEVISLVTNVLSYSRLMALGMASLALADVANELARESSSLFVGIPIAAALHALNVCIGMFSPTLHSLRLNYVESLPKFYAAEGKRYTPFKKEALQ